MREDIWTFVEGIDRSSTRKNDHRVNGIGLYDKFKNRIGFLLASTVSSNPSSKIEAAMAIDQSSNGSLSPQVGQAPTVFFLPGLEAKPVHYCPDKCVKLCPCVRLWKIHPIDPKSPPIPTTGDIEILKQNAETIRRELIQLLCMKDDPFAPFDSAVYSQTYKDNTQEPEWSSIYLFRQGLKQSNTCGNYFPKTTKIIETQCPHRMAGRCGLGSVYFSKLKSNTKVMEHCGPTNVRWRCHLPLIVPKNSQESHLSVGLKDVNQERIGWEEDVPILFDDSFLHSAVHVRGDSEDMVNDGSRIVLIVDFWHPALSEADRNAIGVLYPPGS
eukprot:CCRYP_018762-RA/>CCRYP_018762-RA protein AED:0.15 eAED:0.15 QI:0/-1/0/1/-1/1/1/0/326